MQTALAAARIASAVAVRFFIEAPVEGVEDRIHQIVVEDQPACIVAAVYIGA